MSSKTYFCPFVILSFWSSILWAQQYQGFNTSNYSGITGIYENPANIADGRYLLDINLISADFNLNNNYIAFNTQLLSLNNNPIGDSTYNGAFQAFRNDHFSEKQWNQLQQTRIYQSLNVQGPSFLFNIGKNAFAITSGVRQYLHLDNLDPQTADFILGELKNPSTWNVDLNNQKLNALGAVWAEFGIGYGREILNTGAHFLKGGVHLKMLVAMYSAHLYADELVLNFKNDDTVRVRVSDVRFGYSDDMRYIRSGMQSSDVGNFFANMFNRAGFAADFGFVYEWRPKHEKYAHPTKEGKQVRHKNKYKLKVGFAVADIGGVTFDRGAYAGNFAGFSGAWDLDDFAASSQGIEDFGATMNDSFQMTSNRDPFHLRLPTTLSLQVDYNIWKGFYINLSGRLAVDQEDAPLKMHALNTLTLTPRFEMHQIDFGIPVTLDGYNNITAGMYLRLGPLFVGSTNCWNMIVGPNVYGLNIYGGLKIPITFGKGRKKKPDALSDLMPKPKETLDSTALAKRQQEIEQKAAQDKEWATEQERLAREREAAQKAAKRDTVPTPIPPIDTTPSPEPEPIVEPEPVSEPEPVVEPTPKPNYYDVKEDEKAIKETRAYFQSGSAWISSADRSKLDQLAQKINSDSTFHAIIHGHTDNVGNPESNKKLAAKRAMVVKKYLVEQGVDSERLQIIAEGADNPIAKNDTEEGREKNRRVEVLLLKKEN
ncbi:DUF5723 family protein [Aureispira anguillae]|uniref:DUF5723 family protein n=1 Tax=Aureispira anguillae TaxID=2864201 RepID=A0A915YL78_9BACT|nr:DUF5723 family protein [Aureispira anguillae]BDS15272.1 DUF5723 family protein [Aureispira anguillae]